MHRREGRGSTSALAVVWVVVSIAAPFYFWASGPFLQAPADAPPTDGKQVVLVLLTLIYSSWRIATLIYRGEPRLMHGVFALFVYVTQAMVPLAQAYTGLYPHLLDHSTLLRGQIIVISAILAFESAYAYGTRRFMMTGAEQALVGSPRQVDQRRLHYLTGLSLAASIYYIHSVGDLSIFFQSREALADDLGVGVGTGIDVSKVRSGLTVAFGQVPILLTLIAWVVRIRRVPGGNTVWAKACLLLVLVANIVVNNPISNPRYWFLAITLGLFFGAPKLTERRFRWSLPLAAVIALVAFPYADYFRDSTHSRVVLGPVVETLSTKDYDQSTMNANGIAYVAEYGHTFGHQFLSAVLFFVPRSAWPGKGIDTGVLIGEHIQGTGTTNLSSPLWTEFYVDFGFIGVVFGLLAVGFLCCRLDTTFVDLWRRSDRQSYVLQLLLPVLAGYFFIILRGPLLQSMSRLAVILGVCLFLRAKLNQPQRHASQNKDHPNRGADPRLGAAG